MNLFLIIVTLVTLEGVPPNHIVGVAGPVPYGIEECERRAQMLRDAGPATAVVDFQCIFSHTRPELGAPHLGT